MAVGIGKSALGGATLAARRLSLVLPVVLLVAGIAPALPQVPAHDPDTLDPTPPGSVNPEPLPPLENPNSPKTPAKQLFARRLTPFPGPPRSIGGYADGCLAGATALPIDGPTWQCDCREIAIGDIRTSSPSWNGSPTMPRKSGGMDF